VVYPRLLNATQSRRGQAALPYPELGLLESFSIALCLPQV
jgi:hypothetical protein